ncbi:MAG: Mov34/MPN/PAD-1 family protein [Cytophagaceae bacterium]
MNLRCNEIGLDLIISESLLEHMYKIGMEHYPSEFGGILVGYYSEDMVTCTICETIIPEKYTTSKYSFERGKEGLFEKLELYFNQVPKLIYVGEWHTHPDMSTNPSLTDRQALQDIANNNEVNITNPVLIILSNNKNGYTFSSYIQFKNQLYKYEK